MMQLRPLIAVGASLSILSIPSLWPAAQLSVSLDAITWLGCMVLSGALLWQLVPRWAHACLLLSVLASLIVGVGVAQFAAVLFFLVSALSLGIWLLRLTGVAGPGARVNLTEACLVGAAVWLAIWGAMIHFPVNYRELYVAMCSLPCLAMASRNALDFLRLELAFVWNRGSLIPLWAWTIGLAVIGWVLRWTSFPTMGYDDHAQHLRIWTELATNHQYAFDVQIQIWAIAPFATDLLHAALSLMAGRDSRGAMNLGLAILLLCLMARFWRIVGIPVRAQWLLMVLMASTPMLGNLLLSLQTELALSVLALAGVNLLVHTSVNQKDDHWLGVFACAALCVAIKLPGLVLGATLLSVVLIRWFRQRNSLLHVKPDWGVLVVLMVLGFLALHSYGFAWLATGNPVFPLFNGIFHSPYMAPINFSDSRWVHGFSFQSYVRVFFETAQFFENGNYASGWQYLMLLPFAVVVIWRKGMPVGLRIALIPLFGFGLVMFSSTQYWRYMFPVMPIAAVVLASLFVQRHASLKVIAYFLAASCITFNLLAFPSISWMMRLPASVAYSSSGKVELLRLYAPAALLTTLVNKLAPNSRVLYPASAPHGATLNGVPLYVNWYSPKRELRMNGLKDKESMAQFLDQERVDYVIFDLTVPSVLNSPESILQNYLSMFGLVVAREGNVLLYKLSKSQVTYSPVFDLQSIIVKNTADFLKPHFASSVVATSKSQVLAVIPVIGAEQARYTVELSCTVNVGSFVAQINWDKGAPYYRLVNCQSQDVFFTEAIPVPAEATKGEIYVTARDGAEVRVNSLLIELHRNSIH